MIFWAVLFLSWFSFLHFGDVFNKTIIPLFHVRYEMIIAHSYHHTFSYPTGVRDRGIIVNYTKLYK